MGDVIDMASRRLGPVVRYGDGPTELMRVASETDGIICGEDFLGGEIGTCACACSPASEADHEAWSARHEATDTLPRTVREERIAIEAVRAFCRWNPSNESIRDIARGTLGDTTIRMILSGMRESEADDG